MGANMPKATPTPQLPPRNVMASKSVLKPLQLVSQAVFALLAAYWTITMPNTVKQMNATTTPSMTRPAALDIEDHPLRAPCGRVRGRCGLAGVWGARLVRGARRG